MCVRSLLVFAALCLGAAAAQAQVAVPAPASQDWVPPTDDVEKKALEKPPETPPDGWFPKLSIGGNLSLSHNDKVVGSDDGLTVTGGLLLDGSVEMRNGSHEWLNTLAIRYQQTRTPVVDQFVKSMDTLEFNSTYFYHLPALPWVGPFARFRLTTQMFPSELVLGDVADIKSTDGEILRDDLPARTSFDLAGAFEPLVLRETLGAFAKPAEDKTFTLLVKLGAGAQEIIARDGYVLADDNATAEIEVQQLESSTEVGVEAEVNANGEAKDMFTWSLGANMLYPFITSAKDELEGSPANIEFLAKVGAKLTDWGQVEYVFSAKRIPRVVEEWQLQNGLVLNLTVQLL